MTVIETKKSPKNSAAKKQLGMLVLLLAAETVAAGCCSDNSAVSTELLLRDSSLSTTPRLEDVGSDGSLDEDSLGARTPLSDGEELAMLLEKSAIQMNAIGQNAIVVGLVLSFLPWRKALQTRGINRLWFQQSLSVAAVWRLPRTGTPAVFLPCNRDLDKIAERDEEDLSAASLDAWLCDSCGLVNRERRILCGNRRCQNASPVHQNATRIFLGQLRREATVSMIRWMFDDVLLQSDALMNVQNHRHRETRRGKGCAWVYLDNRDAARDVLDLHRRAFFDSVAGVEGLWVVHPSNITNLEMEIQGRGFAMDHQRHMPRSALVAELPVEQAAAWCNPSESHGQQAGWGMRGYASPASAAAATYTINKHHPSAVRNLSNEGPVVLSKRSDGKTVHRHNPYHAPSRPPAYPTAAY